MGILTEAGFDRLADQWRCVNRFQTPSMQYDWRLFERILKARIDYRGRLLMRWQVTPPTG